MKHVGLLVILLFSLLRLNAQTHSDGQLWLDGELNYIHKLRYTFQDEMSIKSLLFGGSRWIAFDMTPAFEYNINHHFDIVSSVPLSYTLQKQFNSFEVGVMLGTRYYINQDIRPQFRVLLRMENRWYYKTDTEAWDINNRIRIRGEFIYPINREAYNSDDLWYGITDAEVFLSTNADVSERFANRFRFRIGAGYRLNYRLRFEGFYSMQFSRNTIDEDFNTLSNILRLRIKYYFR